MPNLLGVLETALYVDDLARACTFYEQVSAFPASIATSGCPPTTSAGAACCCYSRAGARSRPCTCAAAPSRRTTAAARCTSPSRSRPTSLPPGRRGCKADGIAIEGRTKWPRGGESIYFPRSRRASAGTGDAGLVAGLLVGARTHRRAGMSAVGEKRTSQFCLAARLGAHQATCWGVVSRSDPARRRAGHLISVARFRRPLPVYARRSAIVETL